jgi:hypothetical protein
VTSPASAARLTPLLARLLAIASWIIAGTFWRFSAKLAEGTAPLLNEVERARFDRAGVDLGGG